MTPQEQTEILQELISIIEQLPQALGKVVKAALVQRHLSGKHNQKTHANKFGPGQAKESLRRLKDDKGAREQYKRRARERGVGGDTGASDRRIERAKANVKREKASLIKEEKKWRDMKDGYNKLGAKLQKESDRSNELFQQYNDIQVQVEEQNKVLAATNYSNKKENAKFDRLLAKRDKINKQTWESQDRRNKIVDEINEFTTKNEFPLNEFGYIDTRHPQKQIAKLRNEFHQKTKTDRDILHNENLKEAAQVRQEMSRIPKKVERERNRLEATRDRLEARRQKLSDKFDKLPSTPETETQRGKITDEMIKLDEELVKSKLEITKRKYGEKGETARQYALLNVDNPAKPKIVNKKDELTGEQERYWRSWEDGQEKFNKMVGTGTLDGVEIGVTGGRTDRSHYSETEFGVSGQINMDYDSGSVVMVHELGHALEHHDPFVRDKATDFFGRRTEGEAPKTLNEITGSSYYRSNEVAKKDKFSNPYMGKIYSGGATEIVSMGLEEMRRSPSSFAEKDPDYFDFIYALMRS